MGNEEYPFIVIAPSPLCPGVVALDKALSLGRIELKCELLQHWIEVFWILNCVLMFNWIVGTGTVFECQTELFEIGLFWHLTVSKQKLYLYKTGLL